MHQHELRATLVWSQSHLHAARAGWHAAAREPPRKDKPPRPFHDRVLPSHRHSINVHRKYAARPWLQLGTITHPAHQRGRVAKAVEDDLRRSIDVELHHNRLSGHAGSLPWS